MGEVWEIKTDFWRSLGGFLNPLGGFLNPLGGFWTPGRVFGPLGGFLDPWEVKCDAIPPPLLFNCPIRFLNRSKGD